MKNYQEGWKEFVSRFGGMLDGTSSAAEDGSVDASRDEKILESVREIIDEVAKENNIEGVWYETKMKPPKTKLARITHLLIYFPCNKTEHYMCRHKQPIQQGHWTKDKSKVTCKRCLAKIEKACPYITLHTYAIIDEE